MSARFSVGCAAAMVIGLAALCSCQPKTHVPNPSPFDEDDPTAGGVADKPVARAAPEEVLQTEGVEVLALPTDRAAVRQRLSVERPTLVGFLDRGPKALFDAVQVEAQMNGGKFDGWRILGAATGVIDIRVGDVVLAINGDRIMRPEHLKTAWDKLREVDRVIVAGRRNGGPFELWFEVASAVSAPPP